MYIMYALNNTHITDWFTTWKPNQNHGDIHQAYNIKIYTCQDTMEVLQTSLKAMVHPIVVMV